MSRRVFILLGPQGSGKGTQAKLMADRFHFSLLTMGDIIRREAVQDTALGRTLRDISERGNLVPDQTAAELFRAHFESLPRSAGAVLDGFPRTMEQAQYLDNMTEVTAVLNLMISDDLAVRRITGRRLCPDGHIFNVFTAPPASEDVCDYDGKPLMTRRDDYEQAVRTRLQIYREITQPILDHYQNRGIVESIDGTGSIQDVWTIIEPIVQRYAHQDQ